MSNKPKLTDQEIEALVQKNQRLTQQQDQTKSRLRQALQNVAAKVDNNFERSQSWCLKLIREAISCVLPSKEAKDWEIWINQAYEKYKSSNWKWVARLLIGAIIGWLLGQLLLLAFGETEFVVGLVTKYKWVRSVVMQCGSYILGGLGALWNTLVAYFNGI